MTIELLQVLCKPRAVTVKEPVMNSRKLNVNNKIRRLQNTFLDFLHFGFGTHDAMDPWYVNDAI